MNNFNDPSRLGGTPYRTTLEDLALPIESGVLPEDFPQRIVRLKEASGLSWRGMARALGVDPKQLRRWRRGVEPGGGAMLSLLRFASRVPGGVQILMGGGFQMTLFKNGG